MKITSVNNVSFRGSQTEADKKDKKSDSASKRYFENVSKYDVNKEILLSKGREEKNGKYKVAISATSVGSIITGAGALLLTVAKNDLKNKKVGILAAASIILGSISSTLNIKNHADAEKTAEERGVQELNRGIYSKSTLDYIKDAHKQKNA